MTKYADVHGFVEPGFGAIAETFQRNFDEHGELGAGFSLYVGDQRKVDIHGGIADVTTGRAFDETTLQLVFSTTKGAASICCAHLVDRGLITYDDLVEEHWPELRAAQGTGLTIGALLSHQAGLPYYDTPLTFDEVMAVAPVVAALETQTPTALPGATHGYHAITHGYLVGELVRRVDGRTLGRYFADEVAEPLELEFFIGLPAVHEPRVAALAPAPVPSDPEERALFLRSMARGAPGYRAITLDGVVRMAPENHWNSRALHATEMPAANGITNASSLARMYAATIGSVDGVRLMSPAVFEAARTERVSGPDATLLKPSRFGAGFWLHNESLPMIQDGSFGHGGAGGSLGFANPELGIGFGYVMNQMGNGLQGDPRANALCAAVKSCL